MKQWDPIALRIAGWFTGISALWILLSDRALTLVVDDPARLTTFQTWKGWLYVAFAGAFLYMVTERELRRRVRIEGALQRTERLQDLLVDQVRDHAIFAVDVSGRVATWNAGAESTLGYPAAKALGRDVREFFTEWSDQWDLSDVPDSGQVERTGWCRRADATAVWARVSTAALRDDRGGLLGYSFVLHDLTELKRQDRARAELLIREHAVRMEAEMAASWARFLSESMESLSATLEPTGVITTTAGLAVREFADWVAIYLLEPDGTLVRREVQHRDQPKKEAVDRLQADPVAVSAMHPVREAVRTGRPKLINALTPERLLAYAADGVQFDLMQRLGTRSVIVTPLVARRRAIGAMMVAYGDSGRVYGESDVSRVTDLAGRAALAYDNARLFREAQQARATAESASRRIGEQLRRMDALRTIDLAIAGSPDLRVTLGVILDHVISETGLDAAAVLQMDGVSGMLQHSASRGFRSDVIAKTRVSVSNGGVGRAVRERRHVITVDPEAPAFARADFVRRESIRFHAAFPLMAKGAVLGILEVFHRSKVELADDRVEFLEALAGQAAIAIDSASMFTDLQRTNAELARAYDLTLEGWARALELRDMETRGHSERVTKQTLELAERMGVADVEMVHVRRGALLHDIGKMAIPDSILLKPGPLDDAEWQVMREHPVHAYRLLSPIPFLRPALDIPLFHHEWWDGSGYPYGLRGDSIPLTARIFAVVDVWDALRTPRPYREAWPADQVASHLRDHAGTHLDPRVVSRFLEFQGEELVV